MAKGQCKKRCVDCRKVWTGTAGKYQSCEVCGGETVEIRYRQRRQRKVER